MILLKLWAWTMFIIFALPIAVVYLLAGHWRELFATSWEGK